MKDDPFDNEENYKSYEFIYSDFDQMMNEVMDFDNSIHNFLKDNPDFEYDSCISLSLEDGTVSVLPQLYSFNVVIWKKNEDSE